MAQKQGVSSPSSPGFILRSVREDDRDALVSITIACFDGVSIDQNIEQLFGVIAGCTWEERKSQHVSDDLSANPDGVFVAEVNGEPVGYIGTRLDSHTKIGRIPSLVVAPEYQKLGIGRALVEHALHYLRSEGMSAVRIETLEQNAVGKRFYPKMGFEPVAHQIHYAKLLDV